MNPSVDILTSCYRGGDYLPAFLKQIESQTISSDIHLYLRLVQPLQEEIRLAEAFQLRNPLLVTISVTQTHETLGASWNRLAEMGKGEFIALWNVDDSRGTNSLQMQRDLLKSDSALDVAYGAFGETTVYGRQASVLHEENPRSLEELRSGMHLGPFFMFRRAIYLAIGGFDEQFRSAADFDFALRLAHKGTIGHISSSLGVFLNAGTGLSTSFNAVHVYERTSVEIRYGLTNKIKGRYLRGALTYQICTRRFKDEWYCVCSDIPNFEERQSITVLPTRETSRVVVLYWKLLDWLESRLARTS